MATRYKVTFFDVVHNMRRSVEVEGASPVEAAQNGLRWMLTRDHFPGDFGPSVEVEVISIDRHTLPLATVVSMEAQKKVA